MILSRTAAEAVLSTTGSGNKVRWLVSKEDGSTNYEMREIRIPEVMNTSMWCMCCKEMAELLVRRKKRSCSQVLRYSFLEGMSISG